MRDREGVRGGGLRGGMVSKELRIGFLSEVVEREKCGSILYPS